MSRKKCLEECSNRKGDRNLVLEEIHSSIDKVTAVIQHIITELNEMSERFSCAPLICSTKSRTPQ